MNIHKSRQNWNLDVANGFWIGGHFPVANSSGGYHGILKQWWDHVPKKQNHWLLISEKNNVKQTFQSLYPTDTFNNVDLFYHESEVDFKIDICDKKQMLQLPSYDIIVCQATLEHLFNPIDAVYNMLDALKTHGSLLIHTHTQYTIYHPYPKDYFRFFPDWFIDVPKYGRNIQLLDLLDHDGHIFASYTKNG